MVMNNMLVRFQIYRLGFFLQAIIITIGVIIDWVHITVEQYTFIRFFIQPVTFSLQKRLAKIDEQADRSLPDG